MQYHVKINHTLTKDIGFIKAYPTLTVLHFKAGQYVELVLSDQQTLPFSIGNAPNEEGSLEFYIRRDQNDPTLIQLLNEIEKSKQLTLQGPFGDCVYQPNQTSQVIFLAGGVGISQIKSIVEQAIKENDQRNFYLYWSLNGKDDVILLDDLDLWSHKLNFKHKYIFRDDEVTIYDQVVSDFPDLRNFSVYSSGPWRLTDQALPLFLQHGLPRQHIYSDRFSFITI